MEEKNQKWTLIIIIDPKCLPGKSIFTMLQLLLKNINFNYVIIDDIVGAKISPLVEKENTARKIEYILNNLSFGFFFLK